MSRFISPKGNAEEWEKKPKGYFAQEEWDELHPPPTPEPPTLDEAKAAKIASIDARTHELITRGFDFAGKKFSMSDAAQRNWIALSSALSNNMLQFPMAISTVDEVSHILKSADELKAFLGAYLVYQADPRQPLGSGRTLKEKVTAATTVAEVEAIVDARE